MYLAKIPRYVSPCKATSVSVVNLVTQRNLHSPSRIPPKNFFSCQPLIKHYHALPLNAPNMSKAFAFRSILQASSSRCRNFSANRATEFCGPKTMERFRRRDGMPKSYDLIYRSNFANYLLVTQIAVFLSMGALIAAVATYALMQYKTEEEQRQRMLALKKEIHEMKEKQKQQSLGKGVEKTKKDYGIVDSIAGPELEDLAEGGPIAYCLMASTFVLFAAALFRIQRILPVRIYTNDKNHCVAVFYGHILPGRLTHHEFLSGTVRPVKRKLTLLGSSGTLFKDGSGKQMIIMEQFFRHPADYNKIMGHEEFMEEVLRQRHRKR